MWKSFAVLSLAIIVFLISSCNNNNSGLTESLSSGIYLYTSFDSSGTPIVEGKFSMVLKNSNQIIGKWDFNPIGNPQNIGPQVGNGELSGSTEKNKIWVDLNPQFRDNNLLLSGIVAQNKYIGTWKWFSISGLTNYGTFEAIKTF